MKQKLTEPPLGRLPSQFSLATVTSAPFWPTFPFQRFVTFWLPPYDHFTDQLVLAAVLLVMGTAAVKPTSH